MPFLTVRSRESRLSLSIENAASLVVLWYNRHGALSSGMIGLSSRTASSLSINSASVEALSHPTAMSSSPKVRARFS